MTSTRVRQVTERARSDQKTIVSLVQQLRKLQERMQAVEAAQGEFQLRIKVMENDLEEMAARVDPDL